MDAISSYIKNFVKIRNTSKNTKNYNSKTYYEIIELSKEKKKIEFTGAKLKGANFSSKLLASAIFNNCDLRNANFTGSTLIGAKFIGCKLKESNFNDAYLFGAEFDNCDLSKSFLLVE